MGSSANEAHWCQLAPLLSFAVPWRLSIPLSLLALCLLLVCLFHFALPLLFAPPFTLALLFLFVSLLFFTYFPFFAAQSHLALQNFLYGAFYLYGALGNPWYTNNNAFTYSGNCLQANNLVKTCFLLHRSSPN